MERLTIRNSVGVAVYKHPFYCEECGEPFYRLPDYGSGSPTDKLAEYEDLEEQGRLLRLPCKVGDSMYRFGYADGKAYKVQKLVIRTLANLVAIMESGEFGKSVFLTREEAKAKLKEMETT